MTPAANLPIKIPQEKLSVAQKGQVFDWLRNDLAVAEAGPQDWHFEVLAERERMLASGETRLMPLAEFIAEMRRELP
ncbi:MAG: acyl-protein synthetase [Prosthecobacter sp.]|uniref:acyl-protein synthetase n=1 Tax=Prosthecobacter sp. TaxID=1965333 RepID=UPI0038FF34A2